MHCLLKMNVLCIDPGKFSTVANVREATPKFIGPGKQSQRAPQPGTSVQGQPKKWPNPHIYFVQVP